MAKRVLIFSLSYYPHVGGAEIAIKEITDRIDPSIMEFDMITLRYDSRMPKFEQIGNVHVYRIGLTKKSPRPKDFHRPRLYLAKILYPITAFLRAVSLHKKNKYDMTWSMMSYMGFPALFLSWFYNFKMILTLQEGDSMEHVVHRRRIRMVGYWYKKIFQKADVIQAISRYLADFARDMMCKGKVMVIPNGVDLNLFTSKVAEDTLKEVRNTFGLKENDIAIITTSRLVEKNGVSRVILAMSRMPDNIHFLIVGVGPLEVTLRNQVSDLGLESRVHFVGFVGNQDLPKYLQASQIFIRPSLTEGLGISFIEAMASSIPVIASRVGGIVDLIEDGVNGLFVQGQTEEQIVDDIIRKVDKLLKDPESRNFIVNNALQTVRDKYDWSKIVPQMQSEVFNISNEGEV